MNLHMKTKDRRSNLKSMSAVLFKWFNRFLPHLLRQPAVQAAVQEKQAPVQEELTKEAAKDNGNLHQITSPMVGTFYASSSPDADPYVTEGSKVTESSVVCIVEAMKLFNEIEAEVKGEIVEVLVENGQLVEYGQPLFLVKAE